MRAERTSGASSEISRCQDALATDRSRGGSRSHERIPRGGYAIRVLTVCLSLFAATGAREACAIDIVEGWSGEREIVHLYADNSSVHLRLAGTEIGCGHDATWRFVVSDQPIAKAKLGMLLTAYATGKMVNLRCEAGVLTDVITR